jgi:rfaE bifunctional protein kinase chain/domain
MTSRRFKSITGRYPEMCIAVVGDFSLDRYLEIDPTLSEVSIETGLAVHNVTNVRSQAGSAGTIVNNLAALGISTIFPIGFCGEDGEGYELIRALRSLAGVDTKYFLQTRDRRTFTYCKPLVLEPNLPPRELSRLDSKNWSPTPASVEKRLVRALTKVAAYVDAIIIMDQVDIARTGVVTPMLLDAVGQIAGKKNKPLIIGDSRRGLRDFPPILFKMNSSELGILSGTKPSARLQTIERQAVELAKKNGRHVFVTMAERGILGAAADGRTSHQKALPVNGEIDIVGAGDAVTANLAAALAAGADIEESIIFANAAASIVVHQLGTTGTASIKQISRILDLKQA